MTLSTRAAAAAALLLSALAIPVRAQPPQGRGAPPPQTGTGFISGRVTEGSTTRPVPGAIVLVFGGGPPRIVGADEQGRFFVAGLPAGSFQINASRPGYSQISAFLDRPVPLASGERRTDVVLHLVRQGALSGIVRDDGGDPVVGTDVVAFRRVLVSGSWSLRRIGQARTDDRGVYRITGIDPGDYVVCACLRDPIPFDGLLLTTIASEPLQLMSIAARALSRGADVAELDATLRTYAPTFYGNTVTPLQASRVVVASGDEKSGLDITTPVVRATRVSGRVVGGPVNASNLMLVPAGNASIEGAIAAIPPMLVQADGRFDFAGVPPGQYVIRVAPRPGRGGGMSGAALAFLGSRAADVARPAEAAPPIGTGAPGTQDPTAMMWAEQPVTVGDQGAREVVVVMQPVISVNGRVVHEDPARSGPFAGGGFTLVSSPPDPTRTNSTLARPGSDGTFAVSGLIPGRYSLTVSVGGTQSFLRSVTVGGTDVTDLPIEISANVSDLVITYATGTLGGIDGTVAGVSAATTEALTVLAFPIDRKYWNDPAASRRLFRSSSVDRDGTFALSMLPANDYFICVVRDDAATDWQEATRLEALARTAQRVIVGDGRRTSIVVTR